MLEIRIQVKLENTENRYNGYKNFKKPIYVYFKDYR